MVATRDVPFPKRSVLACRFAHPVPPFATASIVEPTSFTRSMVAVATTPAVALRKPERRARVKFEVERFVEDAVVEKRVVVVACPSVVLPVTKRVPETATSPWFEMVKSVVVAVPWEEEPIAKSVVGARAPVVEAAWIANVANGVVLPMPTLPIASMRTRSKLLVLKEIRLLEGE